MQIEQKCILARLTNIHQPRPAYLHNENTYKTNGVRKARVFCTQKPENGANFHVPKYIYTPSEI